VRNGLVLLRSNIDALLTIPDLKQLRCS